MVVIYVQEIGQVTEARHKLLALRTRLELETRLDITVCAKCSPTSPPSSDSHQHQSDHNPELYFGRFGRLCKSKEIADWVFRMFDWYWEIFGSITRHTGDA